MIISMPFSSQTKLSLTIGATSAALLSGRYLFRPLHRSTQQPFLDWDEVLRVATARGRATAQQVGHHDYPAIVARLTPLMADLCGTVFSEVPTITPVDRSTFLRNSIDSAQRMLGPLSELRDSLPTSRATMIGQRVSSRYVGELFGLLSRRVLGQYDPVIAPTSTHAATMPKPSLYIVEPNITDVQNKHELPPNAVQETIILHELTHAWQFQEHPWLRAYLIALIDDLLDRTTAARHARRHSLRDVAETVRAQLDTAKRIQAVMSVLEGHGNFVMHRIGRRHVPNFALVESAFHQRKNEKTVLDRILFVITGMNLKMRQYDVGERFADVTCATAGLNAVNRVWENASMLPTLRELRHPREWIARTA